MNDTYEIATLLTPKERKHLLALKETCVSLDAHQDYNLFDCTKTQIHPKHLGMYSNKFSPIAAEALEKLAAAARERKDIGLGATVAQYFLDYTEGGFTKFHTDDDSSVALTMVTLLDEQDLEGGETVLQQVYEHKARPQHKYAKRDSDDGPYGQRIVPVVVPVDVGDTMIYDKGLMHGVAKVRKGLRTVLVTWYSSKTS